MMSSWNIKFNKKPDFSEPVFIEGLPGIGNVGKVAVDLLIEQKKLKPVAEFSSTSLPHAVFVGERDLVTLPVLELYHYRAGSQDYLFLAGDVQPQSEASCYSFCSELLDLLKEWNCKEIVTLGGIGLQTPPEAPKLYCAGNNSKFVRKIKKDYGIKDKTYGVVGPIVGVTGLLIGLAKQHKIPAVALLAETFAHPMYVGVKEARYLMQKFNKLYKFDIKMDKIDKEIQHLEKEISKKAQDVHKLEQGENVNYIG